MSKVTGSSLMFDEEEVKNTYESLPRLVRIIFYGLGITNDAYLDRYSHYFRQAHPDRNRKEFSQKAAADRKFLLDRRKLTFNMMRNVLTAMGFDIVSVSMDVRDKLTGEVKTFSTDDSIDELRERAAKARDDGLGSIL